MERDRQQVTFPLHVFIVFARLVCYSEYTGRRTGCVGCLYAADRLWFRFYTALSATGGVEKIALEQADNRIKFYNLDLC